MKNSNEQKASIDIIIERYMETNKLQNINETINYYLDEQNESNSASTVIGLIRNKMQSHIHDAQALAILGGALSIAGGCLGMEDGSRKARLLSMAKMVAAQI